MDVDAAMNKLREAGISVMPAGPDTVRSGDGTQFLVRRYAAAPSRRTIDRDLERAGARMLLLVLPAAPRNPDRLTSDPRVAIVTPEAIWIDGRVIAAETPPAQASPRGPRPYTRFAVARALLAPERRSQTGIAAVLEVSQPSVSNAARKLSESLPSETDGRYPAALFDYAVQQYPGPGGITTYWWHDDPLDRQAETVIDAAHDALVSGDLAARRISAWRVPEHAAVYTRRELDPRNLGFAAASASDYTLSLTIPADPTLWATSVLHRRRGIADPVITAWDVLRSATTGDGEEAAEKLRAKTLALWRTDQG